MNNEELDNDLKNQVNGDDMSAYDYDPKTSKLNLGGFLNKFKKQRPASSENKDTPDNEKWMDRNVEAGKVPVGSIYTETDYTIKNEGAMDYLSEFLSTILLAPFRLTKELSMKSVFLGRQQLLNTIKIPMYLSGACLVAVVVQDVFAKQPINIDHGYASVVTCATGLVCSAGLYFYVKGCKENALVHDLDLDNSKRRSYLNDELKRAVKPETKDKPDTTIVTLSYEEFRQSAEAKLASGKLSVEEVKSLMRKSPNDLFSGAEELMTSNNIRSNENDKVGFFDGADDMFSMSEEEDYAFSEFGGDFS